MFWVLSRWELDGWRTVTAPPCTTRRTWNRKEKYSLLEGSESAWVRKLPVRGMSFMSFRAGTVGSCASGTVGGTDTGTRMKEKDGARNHCRCPYRYGLGKVESAILEGG